MTALFDFTPEAWSRIIDPARDIWFQAQDGYNVFSARMLTEGLLKIWLNAR